ncbi:MAG: ribosomal protein S18-alanine N-acetyltransferase [Euryarchaeota archaeon]|nr:ribosomal protein S18-alanine N-acetyltransferase [Euryarchaeota archaeon]MBU4548068.1 ribosomal protein S18-alanine N-acetyltransferase [Euryarchaeota archaeon]MBV1729314.1 ribosomal protein S18-alanine N-acetyltransferase [Methanobacterium sp.]MBV1755582.1 ribosomal protein S18-alanine N-acetyltransferase [Methanobacterium sp.]MBV1767445.1 ribosomal protein S18-alanine N-acetyltransferase [Methanobacterium sp.]
MIIREFRIPDLKRILEIEEMCFDDPYPPSILKDLYNLGAGFLVAQQDNIIHGYIIFWIRFEDEGHIISLAADKNHRRKQVGSQLVYMAQDIFNNYGLKNIKLEVRAENKEARNFYQSMGFNEEKVITAYYEDGENAIVMNKNLK